MLLKFIKRIIIFAAIITSVASLLFYLFIPQFYIPIFPFLVLFFVISSIAVHAVLTKAGKLRISRFSTFFLGSITTKLFIYIIFITIYVLVDRKTAVPFLVTFLILYFVFTIFETYSLLNDLKKQSQIAP